MLACGARCCMIERNTKIETVGWSNEAAEKGKRGSGRRNGRRGSTRATRGGMGRAAERHDGRRPAGLDRIGPRMLVAMLSCACRALEKEEEGGSEGARERGRRERERERGRAEARAGGLDRPHGKAPQTSKSARRWLEHT